MQKFNFLTSHDSSFDFLLSDPDVLAMLVKHVNETGGKVAEPEIGGKVAEPSNEDKKMGSCSLSEGNSKWTESTKKLLLETYKKIDDGKTLVKNKWAKISEQVNLVAGTNYTAEKCRLKIKTIQEKYCRDKKKNNQSGSERIPVNPQEEEIFSSCPDVIPVCVLDSETSPKPSASNSSVSTLKSPKDTSKESITLSQSVLPSGPSTSAEDVDSDSSDVSIGKLAFQTMPS